MKSIGCALFTLSCLTIFLAISTSAEDYRITTHPEEVSTPYSAEQAMATVVVTHIYIITSEGVVFLEFTELINLEVEQPRLGGVPVAFETIEGLYESSERPITYSF